jgi:membrane protein YqaA with SNARE-associated domain
MWSNFRGITMLRRLYNGRCAPPAIAEYWLALFAFVEASFFPIPPHPVLGLMGLAGRERVIAMYTTTLAFGGGLLGCASGILLSPWWGKSCSMRCT